MFENSVELRKFSSIRINQKVVLVLGIGYFFVVNYY